jgi:hypothetical protein
VGEFTTADRATIPTHLETAEIRTSMTRNAVQDLFATDPTGPVAVDGSGRSAQTFLVEVVAERRGARSRVAASGHAIYAVTAPLVVEAAVRVLAGVGAAPGVAAAGARSDAGDFLGALCPDQLTLRWA